MGSQRTAAMYVYGLVDGPSWIVHAILAAVRKLGIRATEEQLYQWTCDRMFTQCKHWARRLKLCTVWIALDGNDCWRREIYASYKSRRQQRERDPRVAIVYGRILREFLCKQGLPILRHAACEAEDIIFYARTLLRSHRRATGFAVFTRDGDLLQMEDDDTRVVDFWGQMTTPDRLVGSDLLWKKILAGDPSDNIPGCRIWRSLQHSVRQSILSDPQYRKFWLEDHPEVFEQAQRNRQLIDLRCCPSHIVREIEVLCMHAMHAL